MSKIVLTDLANLQNETTAVNAINTDNSVITTEFDNTLSRDGSQPNQMEASLDMNSNRILNLPEPLNGLEPLRLIDAQGLILEANPSAVDGNAYGNIAAVTTAVIPSTITAITVNGYLTAGDGGNGVYYKTASATANPGKITSADGAHWQLKQYPVNVKALGAKGDGTTFDEDAINNAKTLSVQLNTKVFLPAGTYIVRATKNTVAPGIPSDTRYYALDIQSNCYFEGVKGQTTIKLADNQSSDASPKDVGIFVSVVNVDNTVIKDIIFDLNGANNKISPLRGSGIYNGYCCGALNITGNDIAATNIAITGCQFNNCPGVNQLVLGQSANGYAGVLGKNIYIIDNSFINNGLDASDYTSIYSWAENSWCLNNYFFQDITVLSTTDRNWSPFEGHGSNTWFCRNRVYGYYRGATVASNFTSDAINQHYEENAIRAYGIGISVFRGPPSSLTSINEVHIKRNDILILNTPTVQAQKSGIEISVQNSVNAIFVEGNTIRFIPAAGNPYDSVAFNYTASIAGQSINGIYTRGNYVENANTGMQARLNIGTGRMDDIVETDNIYYDLGKTDPTIASYGSRYQSDDVSVPIGKIVSARNSYISLGGSDFDVGQFFGGSITQAYVDNNIYVGMVNFPSSSPYSLDQSSATIARRLGKQICTATAAPATGTWLFGEEFWNYAPSRPKNISSWKYDGSTWSVAAGTGWGTTGERPTLTASDKNYPYFDSTISKMIIWNGTTWLISL